MLVSFSKGHVAWGKKKRHRRGSNPWSSVYETDALPLGHCAGGDALNNRNNEWKMRDYKKKSLGSGGIRTHASEETGALNQRLRPLGHATPAVWEVTVGLLISPKSVFLFLPGHIVATFWLKTALFQWHAKGDPGWAGDKKKQKRLALIKVSVAQSVSAFGC